MRVVPYIGTWIETELVEELNAINLVVPYIGTWIETWIIISIGTFVTVVPYIGTWIETDEIADAIVKLQSYLI